MENSDHVLLQVIVLDADVTLATDIAQLWMLLSTMKDKNKVSLLYTMICKDELIQ